MKLDKLQEAYDEMFDFITDLPSGLDGFESDFDAAYKELLEAKSADVAPVVHGRWETNADAEEEIKDFTCSVCKYQLCDIDTSVIMPGENDFYFCPNCGAKMDLEDDE